MGKNTSFSLDEHYSAFIEGEVVSGRYRSASDVVRAALRLLEDRETPLKALRDSLEAGENSGPPTRTLARVIVCTSIPPGLARTETAVAPRRRRTAQTR